MASDSNHFLLHHHYYHHYTSSLCYFLVIWFKPQSRNSSHVEDISEFHCCRRLSITSFAILQCRHLSRWLPYRHSSQQQRRIMGVDIQIISNTGLVHVIRHGVASRMKQVIYHRVEGSEAEVTPRWRTRFSAIRTLTLLTKMVCLCFDSRRQKHKTDTTHLI